MNISDLITELRQPRNDFPTYIKELCEKAAHELARLSESEETHRKDAIRLAHKLTVMRPQSDVDALTLRAQNAETLLARFFAEEAKDVAGVKMIEAECDALRAKVAEVCQDEHKMAEKLAESNCLLSQAEAQIAVITTEKSALAEAMVKAVGKIAALIAAGDGLLKADFYFGAAPSPEMLAWDAAKQGATVHPDSDRMEWLETNGWRFTVSCWHTGEGKQDNEWTIHTDFENDTILASGKTLRDAIDAARKQGGAS